MKLTQFKDPITGEKGDITNFGDMIQRVLGVIAILGIVAAGQRGAQAIEDASKGRIDTSPDKLVAEREAKKQGIRVY